MLAFVLIITNNRANNNSSSSSSGPAMLASDPVPLSTAQCDLAEI